MKRYTVLVIALLFACCAGQIAEFSSLSHEEYCSKVWRYDVECAVEHMLTDKEVSKVASLAETLKGENCKDTAWNILEWEDENLQYDYEKASLPPPQIVIGGGSVEVHDTGRRIQTPAETVSLRKGICTDYAILTLALLKGAGCDGYLVNVTFEKGEGHVAAAILLNGTFFILDQHLPPLDPGSYYKKWLEEGRKVKFAEVYYGNTTVGLDFSHGYSLSESDADKLEMLVADMFRHTGLKEDPRLSGKMLPPGYRDGKVIKLTLGMAEYYHPEFKMQFARYIFKLLNEKNDNFRAFNLKISVQKGGLEVVLYVAR
ncbi:transglutaminase-like domain-containing protein [Archaeoglobus neptunius]|uniref:transglutaminase-like domain-containing protein n=1 Tax=Archaeoglobus neptunius TaxID=2798580 RepID=UPI0019291FD8|nr:transglutaminase-like domain-containing protein [Archaeoglobus neptunius]